MLPCGIWKGIKTIFDPVVSGFFPTGGAESGLAGMGSLNAYAAFWTYKAMISKKRCPAYKEFQDIENNAEPDKPSVPEEDLPPVSMVEQYISESYTSDIFHKN